MQRYELWNANYSKAFYDIQATVEPAINENGVLLSFKSNYNNAPIMYLQSIDGQYKEYTSPVLINKNQKVSSIIYKENTDIEVSSLNQNFIINTATGKTISANKQPSPSYPGNGGLFSILNLNFVLNSSIGRYSIAVIGSILFSNYVLSQKKKNKKWASYLI